MSRLAIIDWGIGGVSIYKLIKERLGDVPIIYFSDTGVTPYGKMTRSELVSRLNAVIGFLKSQSVTQLIIGCNAASTAIDLLDARDMKIEGMINSGVAAAVKLRPARLGLIGGRRTVLSGVYRRAFASRGIRIEQRIAQPLSGLIESGDVASDTLRAECKRILAPLRNCSHILLACTHYPAIIPVMRNFVSIETVFVDPGPSLVNIVRKWDLSASNGDLYLTTGDPEKMKQAAIGAFNWRIENVERVNL